MTDFAPFRLVVLCTGNRFRSPLAEVLLRQLTEGLPVEVSSCGTLSLEAGPALREAFEAAKAMGLDLSAHRSRHLSEAELGEADLILGFERMHVATAVVDGSAPRERTFTMPELVELLRDVEPQAEDPVERAREAVALSHRARSADAQRLDFSELSDPFGRSPRVYRETADQVGSLCEELAARLFGLPPRPPSQREGRWLKRVISR